MPEAQKNSPGYSNERVEKTTEFFHKRGVLSDGEKATILATLHGTPTASGNPLFRHLSAANLIYTLLDGKRIDIKNLPPITDKKISSN